MARTLDEFGLVATDTDVNLCLSCVARAFVRSLEIRASSRAAEGDSRVFNCELNSD